MPQPPLVRRTLLFAMVLALAVCLWPALSVNAAAEGAAGAATGPEEGASEPEASEPEPEAGASEPPASTEAEQVEGEPEPPPPKPLTPVEALGRDLDRIFAETAPAKSVVAARVLLIRPGAAPAVLYSVRGDRPMVPASTMKVLTTAACWDRLGPDWRMRTLLGHLPATKKGGRPDLAVLGSGDPTFDGRFYGGDPTGAFRRWAAQLKESGLTRVGRILLDDNLFEETMVHPSWPTDQLDRWYAAPVSALNLNDNCVDIRVGPGEAGRRAGILLIPETPYVALAGGITTVAKKADHGYSLVREVLETPTPGMRIRAAGACYAKAAPITYHRTVPDPTRFFGLTLAEALRAEGIDVTGPVLEAALVGEKGLTRQFEANLAHETRIELAVRVANERSQGLYAECLMKLLGAFAANPEARYGAPRGSSRPQTGSWATGRAAIASWLAERRLPAAGCVFDDGSGLSKDNRLTALCVSEVLAYMHATGGERWMDTFAVAGRTGSLRKRMRRTAAQGRVRGKTGYVRGTSALSGYVETRNGPVIVFSILMNDVPWGKLWKARLAQDKACIRLVKFEAEATPE